jgi:outer membrane protein assembly factor BamB
MNRRFLAATSFALTAILATLGTGDIFAGDTFPEWRGVNGQGHADASNLPVSWSENKNIGWKTKVRGLGWSTPVIAKGQVWVTSGIPTPASKEEFEKRRKASTNKMPLNIAESVSLRAICVDLKSGKVVKDIEVINKKKPQQIHVDNSYATPTPVYENGRLYCHYGACGMGCVDTKTSKVIWTNQDLHVEHENGPGSSPILWKGLLILHCDGIDQQYIVALNKETGKEVWKTKRTGKLNSNVQLQKSYATSLIVDVNGKDQVVSPSADWIYGYDPTTGKELWKLSYGSLGFSNAARPIAGGGLIYTCTGYMQSQMLAIKINGDEGSQKPEVVWSHRKQVPNVACPIMIGNEIYFASDKGIATCLNAKTGEVHWTERIGKRFWASPLYADGKIFFFDSDGATTIIEPGKEFKKVSVNRLEGTLFATVAAVDGTLILRTDKALYCIR